MSAPVTLCHAFRVCSLLHSLLIYSYSVPSLVIANFIMIARKLQQNPNITHKLQQQSRAYDKMLLKIILRTICGKKCRL